MNHNKNIFRLEHILESVDKILFISKEKSYEDFVKDWIAQDAIIRNFEIIGEASNYVDEAVKEKFTEVAWNEIRGLRNIIAHVYFEIDTKQIWETIQSDIPELKLQILKILDVLKNEE